LLALI
jgi:hypothetical protein